MQLTGTNVSISGTETFTPTSGSPTTYTFGDFVLLSGTGAGLTVAGPLVNDSGSTFDIAGQFVRVRDASVLTSTATLPMLQLNSSQITAAGNFLGLSTNAPRMTLAGPLLSATNSTLTNGDPASNTYSFIFVGDSAELRSTSSSPLLSFDNASVDTAGAILTVRRSNSVEAPTKVTLTGPLFSATNNSSFNTTSLGDPAGGACCTGFSVGQGAQLTSTTTSPLIQVTNSTFNAGPDAQSGGSFFSVRDTGAMSGETNTLVAPSTVTLAGPLLSATDSTITAAFDLLGVFRSSFTSTSTDPLIQLGGTTGTTLTLGGTRTDPLSPGSTAFGYLLDISGSSVTPATMSLQGPLLKSTNATITATSGALGIFSGASLSSATPDPLVQLSGGGLTLAGTSTYTSTSGTSTYTTGKFLRMSSPDPAALASLTVAGPLLQANNTTISAEGYSFLDVGSNSSISSSGTSPAIQLTSSPLTVAYTSTFTPSGGGTSSTYTSGEFLDINYSNAAMSLAGPLLSATNSPLTLGGGLMGIWGSGQLTSTTPDALIQLGGTTGSPLTVLHSSSSTSSSTDTTGTTTTYTSTYTSGTFLNLCCGTYDSTTGTTVPTMMTLAGPLLSATNSAVTTGDFLNLSSGSSLTSSGTGALIQLTNSPLTAQETSTYTSQTKDAAGNVLSSSTSSSTYGSFLSLGGTLALAGPLLSATDSALTTGDTFLSVYRSISGAATLTSTGSGALVQLTRSPLTAVRTNTYTNTDGSSGTYTGGTFLYLSGYFGYATLTLAGPLLSATDSALTTGGEFLYSYGSSSGAETLTSTGADALVQLTRSPLTAVGTSAYTNADGSSGTSTSGGFLKLYSNATLTLAGPLLNATDSALTTGGGYNVFLNLVGGATFTSATELPLVQLTRSPLTAVGTSTYTNADGSSGADNRGGFLNLYNNATLTLAGPLLSATDSPIAIGGDYGGFLYLNSATFTSTTELPLVQLTRSPLTAVGTSTYTNADGSTWTGTYGNFLGHGTYFGDATLTLAGPLFSATDSALTTGGTFLDLYGSSSGAATLTSTGTDALVQLTGSPLTAVSTDTFTYADGSTSTYTWGSFLNLSNATVTLAGPLLNATDSALTVAGSLVYVYGGRLTSTTTDPLITLTGGSHAIGSGTDSGTGSILDLRGTNTDTGTGLGTDQVLQTGGTVLQVDSATVNLSGSGNGVRVDTALLAASAPIINLINSTLNTSPTGSGAMHLYQSSVTSNGPVFGLNNSTLKVQNGPLLSLTGGSQMNVTGDFASLINGSKIWVQNGPMISVDGVNAKGTASTVNVTGALVNFGGTGGNQVIINNTISPTATQSGIPVSQTGTGSSISIGPNPIKNPGLGTVSVTGSAIQATNGGRVTIQAP